MNHWKGWDLYAVLTTVVRGGLVISAGVLVWSSYDLGANQQLTGHGVLLLAIGGLLVALAIIMPKFGTHSNASAEPARPRPLTPEEEHFFGVIAKRRPELCLQPLDTTTDTLRVAALPPGRLGWVSAIDAELLTTNRVQPDLSIGAMHMTTTLRTAWSPKTSLAIYRSSTGEYEATLFVGNDTPSLAYESPFAVHQGHPNPATVYFYYAGEADDPWHNQGFPR